MDKLSLDNPLFATYVVAATLMILKVVAMAWLTVWRMAQEKGGFRSPGPAGERAASGTTCHLIVQRLRGA